MLDSTNGSFPNWSAASRPEASRDPRWLRVRLLLPPLLLLLAGFAIVAASVELLPPPDPNSPSFVLDAP